jgi:hypothetical protein
MRKYTAVAFRKKPGVAVGLRRGAAGPRHPPTDRDGNAAGALLPGDGDRPEGSGSGRAVLTGMLETRVSTVAVAVVGCGIGRSHIAEGYARHPDKFRVRALCDVDERRLSALADEFSVPRRTRSFDELLRMDDVDIVDICTPPALPSRPRDGATGSYGSGARRTRKSLTSSRSGGLPGLGTNGERSADVAPARRPGRICRRPRLPHPSMGRRAGCACAKDRDCLGNR